MNGHALKEQRPALSYAQCIIHRDGMKVIDMIAVMLVVLMLYDGFNGEFYAPTIFDVIKWIAFVIFFLVYLASKAVTDEKKQ